MDKLLPSIRVSGGAPAGIPDFCPVDRSKLKDLLRPMRPALYQVWVDANGGGSIAVGPRCSPSTALALAETIQTQVSLGQERVWSNPRVVLAGGRT